MRRQRRPLVGALTTLLVRPSVWAGTFGITAIGCISEEIARNDLPDGDLDEDGLSQFDDCDDREPLIYPGASYAVESRTERVLEDLACQSGGDLDVDCDGEPDYFCVLVNPEPEDLDGDEFAEDEDCDDTNAQIYPGASYEIGSEEAQALTSLSCEVGEGIDADCDGEAEYQCVITNMAD